MKRRFYLDTAIWRDYFEDWHDNLRPLGEFAFKFLKDCEKNDCEVLFSPLVAHELHSHYSAERVKEVFSSFTHYLKEVFISPEELSEARTLNHKLKDTHTSDIVHAILARDNCAVLITRDRHFETLSSIVQILSPEEVTFD